MARRSKLEKFAANQRLPNVFENFSFSEPKLMKSLHESVDFKGSWSVEYFQNDFPLILELACGRGEYSLSLAERYADKNFIGVDIKGARIWKGASIAQAKGLNNVAFVRSKIELLPSFFGPAELSEIWITFPDPFPRDSKSNRRLTSPYFLDLYHSLLKKGALLHLKTDDPGLYEFSRESILSHSGYRLEYQHEDIYAVQLPYGELEIKTYYERLHLAAGKKIKYLRAVVV